MRRLNLLLLSILAACASACATVPPGHAGVLVQWGGVASEPLGEGVHVVGPMARVDVYDLRSEVQTEDLVALSADGAPLEARASVLTFHPVPSELVPLAREVGPNYYRALIRPVVRSVVRRVLAGLRADELDTPGIIRAEREITALTAARLRPAHIIMDAINIRTLALYPTSAAYRAVEDTGVAEQHALTERTLVELARRRADERREDARGVAAYNSLVAPTLTPNVLSDAANRAWTHLLTGPSTLVQILPTAQHRTLLEVSP